MSYGKSLLFLLAEEERQQPNQPAERTHHQPHRKGREIKLSRVGLSTLKARPLWRTSSSKIVPPTGSITSPNSATRSCWRQSSFKPPHRPTRRLCGLWRLVVGCPLCRASGNAVSPDPAVQLCCFPETGRFALLLSRWPKSCDLLWSVNVGPGYSTKSKCGVVATVRSTFRVPLWALQCVCPIGRKALFTMINEIELPRDTQPRYCILSQIINKKGVWLEVIRDTELAELVEWYNTCDLLLFYFLFV